LRLLGAALGCRLAALENGLREGGRCGGICAVGGGQSLVVTPKVEVQSVALVVHLAGVLEVWPWRTIAVGC
jgi:hypothetical protein